MADKFWVKYSEAHPNVQFRITGTTEGWPHKFCVMKFEGRITTRKTVMCKVTPPAKAKAFVKDFKGRVGETYYPSEEEEEEEEEGTSRALLHYKRIRTE